MYNYLKNLTEINELWFFSRIQEIDWYTIESFSYRLLSWSEFNEDSRRKESRWIAYIYWRELKEPKLFTIWYHKFFNYWEGEGEKSTVNLLKTEKIESITDKLDGSLIMVWKLPTWKIVTKSKTSIISDQAIASQRVINKNKNLKNFINTLLDREMFPIFEYVWPKNRIVIWYKEEDLILLWIRKVNREYLSYKDVLDLYKDYQVETWITKVYWDDLTLDKILSLKEKDTWYEWFIVNLSNWERVKIKLDYYIRLHHTKDEINNDKKLVRNALYEELDDLRSLFAEEIEILERINNVESQVFKYYNLIRSKVESEYLRTKEFERKEYAICHKEKNPDIFWLLMSKYLWKLEENNIKDYVEKTMLIKE